MSAFRNRLRIFLARHLFAYLALIVAVAGGLSILFARDELRAAWKEADPRWVPAVLGLTFFGYLCRFTKWQMLLRAVGLSIPLASSARIYFACFAMVVTPFRLGEFYKVVFLKKLHRAELQRSAPVLVIERVGDVLAILALASLHFDRRLGIPVSMPALLLLALLFAHLAAHANSRRSLMAGLRRMPILSRRAGALEEALEHNATLLRVRHFLPALLWSLLAWGAECVGLWVLLRALGSDLPLVDASWIYATATALGNVTFLPGGLGSTELTMAGLLLGAGVARATTVPATLLVRVATLWLAVAVGLFVTLFARRALRWSDVQADASSAVD